MTQERSSFVSFTPRTFKELYFCAFQSTHRTLQSIEGNYRGLKYNLALSIFDSHQRCNKVVLLSFTGESKVSEHIYHYS